MLSTIISLLLNALFLFSSVDRPFKQIYQTYALNSKTPHFDQPPAMFLFLKPEDFQCPACRKQFEQLGSCLQKLSSTAQLSCTLFIDNQNSQEMSFSEYQSIVLKQLTGFLRGLHLKPAVFAVNSNELSMNDSLLPSLFLAHPGYHMIKRWSLPLSKEDLDELIFFVRGET